ncbi:hypothetical protein ES703_99003 [subsurface metagenome]
MGEIDFVGVERVLLESAKLVRGTRRLLDSVGVVVGHMSELECNLRDRAAEVRAYLKQEAEDKDRPLIN